MGKTGKMADFTYKECEKWVKMAKFTYKKCEKMSDNSEFYEGKWANFYIKSEKIRWCAWKFNLRTYLKSANPEIKHWNCLFKSIPAFFLSHFYPIFTQKTPKTPIKTPILTLKLSNKKPPKICEL
jgi:hypothetical protein